jgi:hypothetical protein
VAKKEEDLVGYCRVIGDGITKGFVSEFHVDNLYDTPDFFGKMMKALAAKAGHTIYVIPEVQKPASTSDREDKGTDGIELSSTAGAPPDAIMISCLQREELQRSSS